MNVTFLNGRLTMEADSPQDKLTLKHFSEAGESGVRIFGSFSIYGATSEGVDVIHMDRLPETQQVLKEIFGIRLVFYDHIKKK